MSFTPAVIVTKQSSQYFNALRSTMCLLILLALFACTTFAQPRPNISGDYSGLLGQLHVKLHITTSAKGAFSGTLDSPDQGASGLPFADFHLDGAALSFSVPSVHGTWKGSVGADGASLQGTWSQGSPMPLNFVRNAFVPSTKPLPLDGTWLGTLHAGTVSLRVQLNIKSDQAGGEFCTLDSLDQHAMGLECAKVVVQKDQLSFEVPAVHGAWSGKLSVDGNTLSGIWSQGSSIALDFTRQNTAVLPLPVSYDHALAPVKAGELQSILTSDLALAFKDGALAPSTEAGMVIGIAHHGMNRVFAYGTAKPDSIFEIGSITKTFTGLLLAQMVQQGKVSFDEPVRELLPAGTVAKPAGAEITLLDLATQHSGLPPMPGNFKPADIQNPYADYRAADLYAFMAKQGVEKPAAASFLYSNLGLGLLGQALAVRANSTYSRLLQDEITDVLGMKDTVIALSPKQQSRFIAGHDDEHHLAHAWDLDALAGAGAIRSTAQDMLTYLEANLHPEKLASNASTGATAASTLSEAFVQSHKLQADVSPSTRIALAWLYNADTGNYWHNGATGGYSSYAFFNPKSDVAVIVLLNTTISGTGSFADRVGQHIMERLTGKPAVSLGN